MMHVEALYICKVLRGFSSFSWFPFSLGNQSVLNCGAGSVEAGAVLY